jgi:hypothetical protein
MEVQLPPPRTTCAFCGREHDVDDMDFAFRRPDPLLAVPEAEREARCSWDVDLAKVDETFYVRCVLYLPRQGGGDFGLGLWVRVSPEDFGRYLSVYEHPDQANEPPFRGVVANQVATYPPTIGLPVTVRLTGATTRPVLVCDASTHPLAVEQREGVSNERITALLAPGFHAGETPPLDEPRVPVIAEEGWTLGLARVPFGDGRASPPPPGQVAALAPGWFAKLVFRFATCTPRGEPATKEEWMWVEVDHAADRPPRFSGLLTNHPFAPGVLRRDQRVWFGPEHVLGVQPPEAQA